MNGGRVFRAAVTATRRRRPSRARRPRHFRRRPDVRTRVERRGRVERQGLGRRRSVHLLHFERVVAVLQQTVRRAVQLDVIACAGTYKTHKKICQIVIFIRSTQLRIVVDISEGKTIFANTYCVGQSPITPAYEQ